MKSTEAADQSKARRDTGGHERAAARFLGSRQFRKYTGIILLAILFLGGWKVITVIFSLPTFILPPPEAVAGNLIRNTANGVLLEHAWVTAIEVILGLGIGTALGVLLGFALSLSRTAQELLYPYIIAGQTIPKIAVAPLLVLWFGFGITPKVIGGVILVFFPVFVNTLVGIHSVDPNTRELFKSLNASRWEVFFKLEVFNSLPLIFASLKIAVTLAVIGAVTVEFVGANQGLGYLAVNASYQANTELLFSSLVALTVLGLVAYFSVTWLERFALRKLHFTSHVEASGGGATL